ncbi:MAG: peptidoglycan-binding protein [Clostridia bacterium]|nr:peptidoglycan-binding protein [Clostridia bacterium]
MKKFTWIALVMTLILLFTAVAGAETYDHVLKRGMKDKTDTFPDGEDDIKYVQTRLAYYEYYTGNIDGNYGSGTYKAVLAFQRKNNLKADGKVGGNTWAKLVASDSVKKSDFKIDDLEVTDSSDTVIATVGFQKLQSGDKGDAVTEIQKWLQKILFYNPDKETTGVFDTTTKNAVKAFQSAVGLTSDGIVGEKTYNVLKKAKDSPESYFNTKKMVRRVLSSGMRGYDVYILKVILNDKGYLNPISSPLGYFDSATTTALGQFQKKNNIKVTSKTDANTKAALWGEPYEETAYDIDASETAPYSKPKLKYGSHGTYVRIAQQHLLAAGCMTGSADGVFGAKTLAAVKKFQSLNGLKEDGIIGEDTWAKLVTVPVTNNETIYDFAGASSMASSVLKRGSKGTKVFILQSLLVEAGVMTSEQVDGIFGAVTETCVKRIQKEAGLKIDGKVGAETLSAIYKKAGY